LAIALGCRDARAQVSSPARLGYVWIGSAGTDGPTISGIRQGFVDVGLIDGRDFTIDVRYADGRPERLSALIEELVQSKIALLIIPGGVTTAAARAVTATVPIVSTSGDPVGSGFAQSLARPGGNITGMALVPGDRIAEKWVGLLRDAAPSAKVVGLVVNPDSPLSVSTIQAAQRAGRGTGMEIVPVPVARRDQIDAVLGSLASQTPQGIIISDDPLLLSVRHPLLEFAAHKRLPAVCGHREYALSGALISYSSDVFDVWRRAGGFAKKILNGENPADLPIEQPTKLQLVLNLKTAQALGLDLPATLLARADEVIE
jgi:putative ABC transport system substrate-binding protein